MTSKQSKHQAATGSQPKDGIRKPARLTILAIIHALCIAAAIAFHAQEGVQQLMEDPARICIWSLCFLLCLLILRLMRMGERQQEPFGRIYCYCVAAILLFHVLVNVGMTIGLMPVMGIPLPFMSYGGSSLIAFTILLFIAVRLDASTRQFSVHKL
mgnify:CR=1 FL=1